jgi:membrane fusion protein (multidrug efflux system)
MSEKTSNASRARVAKVLRRTLPGVIVIAALGGVVVLARSLPKRSMDKPPVEPPPVPVRILDVRTVDDYADTLTLHAVTAPNRVVRVAAEVSGQIEAYGRRPRTIQVQGETRPAGEPIDEGEPVVVDQPLVLIDRDILQAEYDRAETQLAHDTREYQRYLQLLERDVATRTEVEQAETRMKISRAALAQAEERLREAVIEAPIGGILNDLPQEVGQFVQPGTYVAEIVDLDPMKIAIDVPERDVPYLGIGDEVTVLLDRDAEKTLRGTISFISELADEATRTTRVEALIPNPDREMRSGQIVRVRLTRQVLDDVILIPLGAVIPLEDGKVVYVVEDGRAVRRNVKLGFMKGFNVRILDGLADGETLIIDGQRYVGPGQPVEILEQGFAGVSSATGQAGEAATRPAGAPTMKTLPQPPDVTVGGQGEIEP